MSDPWAFGWTHVLTLAGFALTTVIAFAGFRTFGRWRREKLEEKRIEVAIEALALAYKSRHVFEMIRSPLIQEYEWREMPEGWAKDGDKRRRVGAYWAILHCITLNKDFFDEVWELQPRCMSLFGPEVEETFMQLHRARRNVEVAAQMLAEDAAQEYAGRPPNNDNLYKQLRADISGHSTAAEEGDRIGRMLNDFREGLIRVCRPIVDRGYRPATERRWRFWSGSQNTT